jgi:hypothetical protein
VHAFLYSTTNGYLCHFTTNNSNNKNNTVATETLALMFRHVTLWWWLDRIIRAKNKHQLVKKDPLGFKTVLIGSL